MTDAADHFSSLDATLAAAKAAWDKDRGALLQRIRELETELSLTKAALDKAGTARDEAFRQTAKLLTQFGVVATVFDEAKQTAIAAGLYTEQSSRSEGAATVTIAPNELGGAK